jgi:N-acyl homoserine lactone hydrolase
VGYRNSRRRCRDARGEAGTKWLTHVRRSKTLAAQLEEIGVKPSDIKLVGISHTHPDHIGNVELFPQSTLLVQAREYDWPLPSGGPRFKPERPVNKLNGNYDVFADGKRDHHFHSWSHAWSPVVAGQAAAFGCGTPQRRCVHFKDNWENRRVPAGGTDKHQTLASMQRIADLLAQNHAQLWINHDLAQSRAQKHAPEFYD